MSEITMINKKIGNSFEAELCEILKNCQRHVDVDNFRTHPCWQWRGLGEGE